MKIDVHIHFSGLGIGVVAYVSLDQCPQDFQRSFDASAAVNEMQAAIDAIKAGDGKTAVQAAGSAWFRIASFHY